MLRRCAEKVERLISIDCSSPTSASTWSNTGSVASTAGGRRPDWWSSAARPSVFSATVLPPVFGPLTTSTRRSPSSRSIGTARRSGRAADAAPRAAAPRRRRTTAAPRQRRESTPAGEREVERAGRLDQRLELGRALADEPRELAQDPLDLLALGARGLGKPVVQLDDRERLDEQRLPRARRVVHDARHLPARRRLDREDGPAAALGDEALLEELGQLARARDARQLLGHALLAVAQLGAEPPQRRRCVVAQVGAVLGSTARSIASASAATATARQARRRSRSSGASAAASPSARLASSPIETASRDQVQVARAEHAVARRVRRGRAHVGEPRQRRLRRVVEQRDRLGRQRLAAQDLVAVGRRDELARELGAAGALGRACEALDDRRKLQHGEGMRIHAGQCTEARFAPRTTQLTSRRGAFVSAARFSARRSLSDFCAGFFATFFGFCAPFIRPASFRRR